MLKRLESPVTVAESHVETDHGIRDDVRPAVAVEVGGHHGIGQERTAIGYVHERAEAEHAAVFQKLH